MSQIAFGNGGRHCAENGFFGEMLRENEQQACSEPAGAFGEWLEEEVQCGIADLPEGAVLFVSSFLAGKVATYIIQKGRG